MAKKRVKPKANPAAARRALARAVGLGDDVQIQDIRATVPASGPIRVVVRATVTPGRAEAIKAAAKAARG